MDYSILRTELARENNGSPIYAGMSDQQAADYMNTTTVQVSRGVITTEYFGTLAIKVMGPLAAANKGDAIRAPFEELISMCDLMKYRTIDVSNPMIAGALELAVQNQVDGFNADDLANVLYTHIPISENLVGVAVTAEDIELARR